MDYLASMIKTNYAAHGYGGFFTTALMDRHYKSDLTRQQAYNLMIECVKEVQKRLVLNLPNFAAHGYGGFFTTALMDRHYKSNMNKEEAYKLMIECVKEVQKRLVINLPNFA